MTRTVKEKASLSGLLNLYTVFISFCLYGEKHTPGFTLSNFCNIPFEGRQLYMKFIEIKMSRVEICSLIRWDDPLISTDILQCLKAYCTFLIKHKNLNNLH